MSKKRYAILLNADTNNVGAAVNGFEYAKNLDESGHEVELYFDGAATKWIDELENNPEHPANEVYSEIRNRELVAGACSACADAFGASEACEIAGVETMGDPHGPNVGELASEDYEILTIG